MIGRIRRARLDEAGRRHLLPTWLPGFAVYKAAATTWAPRPALLHWPDSSPALQEIRRMPQALSIKQNELEVVLR
jgi:hypothetical protein